MAQPNTDNRLLAMLRLRDEGLSCAEIGKRIGMSKSSVAGALWRIDVDVAKAEGEGAV
tara:strand:- start:41113 stop:41286 length:174 start_codon:yes stop_codon:yes gene_type:complete